MLARHMAIGFGIAIIFPLLVYYGVSSIHSPPKWADYHKTRMGPPPTATTEQRKEFADRQQAEGDAYGAAAKEFARLLVIIATPLGVAAILIGCYVAIHSIGTGLILGGIGAVGFGYWNYWNYLDDWMRFVSLLIAFGILLLVGKRMYSATHAN
jgi:hypothetical protein